MSVNEPRGTPLAKWVALLIGIIFLAISFIGARELYILGSDTTAQESWIEPVLQIVGSARYQDWMLPLGIVSAVLGIALLYVSLRPRIHTHRQIKSSVPVYMRPIDLMRMFTAAAESVRGVSTARTSVKTRHITVTVDGDTTDPELSQRVQTAVEPLAQLLASTPSVSVSVGSLKQEEGVK